MYDLDDETIEDIEEIEYKKDMTRAERRKKNWHKAIRKRQYGYMHLYDKPLHSLNKGKNFCSCSLCKTKTNPKGKRYFGRQKVNYKQRNWKVADKRKIDYCEYSLQEYYSGQNFDIDEFWSSDDAYVDSEIMFREQDWDMIIDYICNTSDNVLLFHDMIRYKEDYCGWFFRNYGHTRHNSVDHDNFPM